jgi:hypothetical protein
MFTASYSSYILSPELALVDNFLVHPKSWSIIILGLNNSPGVLIIRNYVQASDDYLIYLEIDLRIRF